MIFFFTVSTFISIVFSISAFLIAAKKSKDKNQIIKPNIYKWILWNSEEMSCVREGAIAFLSNRLEDNIEYCIQATLMENSDSFFFKIIGNKKQVIEYTKSRKPNLFFTKIDIFVRSDQIDEFELKTAKELS